MSCTIVYNRYGHRTIYDETALRKSSNYIISASCLTARSEALSWANFPSTNITRNPFISDNIIIQGCQRNDLAVLTAIELLEKYKKDYIGRNIYLTGCLAKRFDIEIPKGVHRLNTLKKGKNSINKSMLL